MYETSGNIINGGLLVKFWNKEIVSDFNRYWFLNMDEEFIYYSDGTKNHSLYRTNDNDPDGSLILQKPCTNVLLNGDWLYYINESDRRVYRCLRSGRSESLILRERVIAFVMPGMNDIIYVTEAGDIKDYNGTLAEQVHPAKLCIAEGYVFYADGSNNGYLTSISLKPDEGYRERCIGKLVPTAMNSNGAYVFFTDGLKDNNLFRLTLKDGSIAKMYGESAAYLHIIDDDVYFWNGVTWKHVSVEGGSAKEVR